MENELFKYDNFICGYNEKEGVSKPSYSKKITKP